MRSLNSLLLALFLGFSTYAQAQQTIVDPSRSVDWRNAGVPGGIPVRTTTCATLSPGATPAQINNAIAACPANQVVKLNAGTYNLSTGIHFNGKSNVTLRGAGPDRTFLIFNSADPCLGLGGSICVNGSDLGYYIDSPTHVANWTAGYAQGSTQITLSNTTGLSVGMYIVLDQLNDTADTGNVFVCSIAGVCADEGPGGSGRANREQQQFVKVTAINGTTLTITPAIHMPNWRSARSPQAYWGNPSSMIFKAGVEDLSMDHSAVSNGKSGVFLMFAVESWVKNVRSIYSNRNHVWFYSAARNTVRDSYFYGTQNAASQSYGIEEYMASDNLVENNILHHIAVPLQTNEGSGSVFGYNYSFDDYYNVSPNWQQASSYLHAAGTDMVLHEGNSGTGFTGDVVHGSHNFVTAFRNYFIGWEPGKTAQTNPVKLYTYNRYMNLVGNVLGKAGYHTLYEWNVSGSNPNLAIFNLGSGSGSVPSDAMVKTTIMRWGNYDVATGTVRFVASEVPSGLSLYDNPVPPNQTLPASFYLPAKPSWWGSMPWPAIGPDVTGGFGPGGHAHKIPAQVCYDITPKVNGILDFNALNCYLGVNAPTPPANLRIIP